MISEFDPSTFSRASTPLATSMPASKSSVCDTHTALDYPADQVIVNIGNTLSATFS